MNKLYILCVWIWIGSIIIFFIPKLPSLLYLSSMAILLDLIYPNIYLNAHISKLIGLYTIQIIILCVNVYKHLLYKIPFLSVETLFFNLLFLSIYFTYLNINQKNMYEIYFIDLINRHNNKNETLLEYIKSEYVSIFLN